MAALFAYHPDPGGSGNLGQAFRRTLDPNGDNTAIERRFTALLTAHPDDLPFYLRQAISFLQSKEVPVDWHQLFADVLAWGHPDRYVQKQWARSFWGRPPTKTRPNRQGGITMFIELHLIQSFAPANLNRDDTNNPKDCEFGGVRRARISSQCIKRAIRKEPVFAETTGMDVGQRTKRVIERLRKQIGAAKPEAEVERDPACLCRQLF